MLYYITIGNTDDKLKQQQWAEFCREVDKVLRGSEFTRHFHGYSLPNAPWQNAIWAVEMDESDQVNVERVKELLRWVADRFKQGSIAWTQAPFTEFLVPERKLDNTVTQRGTCQRAVLVGGGDFPTWQNCGLADEHEGTCVWDGVRHHLPSDGPPRFTIVAPCGAGLNLECLDGDCEAPITSCGGGWTLRDAIDAATDHNRRYHS